MSGALAASFIKFVIDVVWNPTSHTLDSIDAGVVTSGIIFRNDGTVDHNDNGSVSQVGTWHKDAPAAGLGDNFEITAASGGSGSWGNAAAVDDTPIALTSDRTWDLAEATIGLTNTASRTFTIGEIGVPSNAASAVCECSAQRIA